MKKLLPILVITLTSLLLSKEAMSLPNCSGNYWNNCMGVLTFEFDHPNWPGATYSGEFKNGKREGAWVWENKNGQLNTKGNYKNGKEEGTWVTYYDSGKLSDKGVYKSGKKEGTWIRNWNKIQLMSKGGYENSIPEGAWVWYKQDGTVWKEYTGIYKNGKKISD